MPKKAVDQIQHFFCLLCAFVPLCLCGYFYFNHGLIGWHGCFLSILIEQSLG